MKAQVEILGAGSIRDAATAALVDSGRRIRHAEDRSRRERFFRGARLMEELAHPRIVRVLESEQADDGWRFFVMEYGPGGSFEQAVLAGGLTPEQGLEIVRQVGEALEHAHRRGAVHRDARRCRSASRFRYAPGYRDSNLGFRLVRTAS